MDPLWLAVSIALSGPTGAALGLPAAVATAPEAPSTRLVAPVTDGSTNRAGPWRAPVQPLQIDRAFDAPTQDWLPGHRGVDLRAPAGTAVSAPADGVVAFAGMVAGRPVLSVDHVDPHDPTGTVRTTYEPVTAAVSRGDRTSAGQTIGTVADATHCDRGCLHWGARRGRSYVDPMSFLRARIRLWTPHG